MILQRHHYMKKNMAEFKGMINLQWCTRVIFLIIIFWFGLMDNTILQVYDYKQILIS